jgi:hypothetical protein
MAFGMAHMLRGLSELLTYFRNVARCENRANALFRSSIRTSVQLGRHSSHHNLVHCRGYYGKIESISKKMTDYTK